MKTSSTISAIVFSLLFSFCGIKKAAEQVNQSSVKQPGKVDSMYIQLRSLNFSFTGKEHGLDLSQNNIAVFGTITDWNTGTGIATITSYQTGDASLYLSTGGGFLGGIGKPDINQAAKHCVLVSQNYLNYASPSQSFSLPGADSVRFFLLTNKGVFSGQESYANLEKNNSPWVGLFQEVNNVITAINQNSEK